MSIEPPGIVRVRDTDVHTLAGAYGADRSAVLAYAPGVDPEWSTDYAVMPEMIAIAAGYPIVARASVAFAVLLRPAPPLEDGDAHEVASWINLRYLTDGPLLPQ